MKWIEGKREMYALETENVYENVFESVSEYASVM